MREGVRGSHGELLVDPTIHAEAMRCADFGPLFVRRRAFLDVGGFNETGTVAGEPGSVRVDCELQARLWVRGLATVYVGLTERQRWSHSEERRAWGHPSMTKGHERRMRDYWERFERDGSVARTRVTKLAMQTNALFKCPKPVQVTEPRRSGFMTMPMVSGT